jgi:hypothetical protein
MIEVLKQALDALEDFVDVIKYDNEQDDIGRRACCDVLSYNPHSESCKAKQAITAIKEAIREHAMYEVQRLGQEIEQEPDYWLGYGLQAHTEKPFENATALYTHQLQLEQNFCSRCGKRTNDIHTCTPPQRTWAGLTNEERMDILLNLHRDKILSHMDTALAIEAKLKEKNT